MTVDIARNNQAMGGDGATARAAGVLATRLTEALGQARQALEPHATLLPAGMLADLYLGVLQESLHVGDPHLAGTYDSHA